jgi:hypothetical protein
VYIAMLLASHCMRGHRIVFAHVKGHSGDEGNENADRLANLGCTYTPQDERNWAVEEEKWKSRMAALDGTEMELAGTQATAQQDHEDAHPISLRVGECYKNGTRSESNSKRRNIIISEEVCR